MHKNNNLIRCDSEPQAASEPNSPQFSPEPDPFNINENMAEDNVILPPSPSPPPGGQKNYHPHLTGESAHLKI
jgi:hypothetical protein